MDKKKFNVKPPDEEIFNFDKADRTALIDKIKELQTEIDEYKEWNNYLVEQLKRSRPLEIKGSKENASWSLKYDEKKNLLLIKLEGLFSPTSSKSVSLLILNLLTYSRPGFISLFDVKNLEPSFQKRAAFHVRKIIYYCKVMNIKRAILLRNPEKPETANFFVHEMGKLREDMKYEYIVVDSLEEAAKHIKTTE